MFMGTKLKAAKICAALSCARAELAESQDFMVQSAAGSARDDKAQILSIMFFIPPNTKYDCNYRNNNYCQCLGVYTWAYHFHTYTIFARLVINGNNTWRKS